MFDSTATIDVDTSLGPFRVYAEGAITRDLQVGTWWDDHLKPVLDEVESGCAIDIGAHFGWFTVYLAQRLGQVIAVEPYPSSFALLRYNVQQRPGLEHRIQCWPVAAYDTVAALRFDRRNCTTDAGAFGFTPTEEEGIRVAGVALDPYLTDVEITLIKCDAQGADLRALRGLRKTLERCRPLVVFEWEAGMAAWHGDTWDAYLAFFAGLHYSVERIVPDYWDYCARPR
jgi:FkbM family methyltransferase